MLKDFSKRPKCKIPTCFDYVSYKGKDKTNSIKRFNCDEKQSWLIREIAKEIFT